MLWLLVAAHIRAHHSTRSIVISPASGEHRRFDIEQVESSSYCRLSLCETAHRFATTIDAVQHVDGLAAAESRGSPGDLHDAPPRTRAQVCMY